MTIDYLFPIQKIVESESFCESVQCGMMQNNIEGAEASIQEALPNEPKSYLVSIGGPILLTYLQVIANDQH